MEKKKVLSYSVATWIVLQYCNHLWVFVFVFNLSTLFRRQIEDLLEQLRELKDVNSRLFKLVSDRDFEIKRLKRKRDEDRAALAGTIVLLLLTSGK